VGYAAGEARELPLSPAFDRRIKLKFHGTRITSDGGLLAYRELQAALGLTAVAVTKLFDGRRGKNARHTLGGLFRQSVFGRLAGYEDVNDAERLALDPAMRALVGREGLDRAAASSSQMGRFETEWRARDTNLAALTDLSGTWIDRVHELKPPRTIILDMDSSESPRRAGGLGLAWPLRLHLLLPAVSVQPIRRPGALPAAARQCPQCRELAPGAGAGGRPLPREGHRALLPGRCCVRQARDLLAAGGRGHPLRDPLAGQPGVATADRAPADPAGRPATEEVGRFLHRLPLPGQGLDPTATRGSQGGVAPRRALASCRVHRDQPDPIQSAGGQFLQRPWHGRAVDPRGQERASLDRLSCHAFRHNAVRLQLHALAYNLANFMRTLALPEEVAHWSLTTLCEKLVKIGARIVRHGRYVVFQLAEVAVPRSLFASILRRIDHLRPKPPPLPA
jgi:hypothetical protein